MTAQFSPESKGSSTTKKDVVERFISVTQGSAGILEAGHLDTGLYTDKIATCRPYVFVCKDATIMLHDTGQIQLDAIVALIAGYGKIKAVHYVEGRRAQEGLHRQRLLLLAQRLQFKKGVHRPVAAYVTNYNSVGFTRSSGLRILTVERGNLSRDPNHDQREAVNMLNDTFTPARTQSAPLDVQYVGGKFAPPAVLKKSLVDMFKEVIVDGNEAPENGLIGIAALFAFMPAATPGVQLPADFVNFVKEHGLESLVVSPFREPEWYADQSMRHAAMEKFKALPIFGA